MKYVVLENPRLFFLLIRESGNLKELLFFGISLSVRAGKKTVFIHRVIQKDGLN